MAHTFDNGRQIIFAGTHLCHEYTTNRLAQATAIAAAFGNKEIPVIMGGDFNFRPDTDPYRAITEKFIDAARAFGREENTIPFENPHARIDYIFLSKGHPWRVKDVQVIKTDPSDHMPVLVTLELLDDRL